MKLFLFLFFLSLQIGAQAKSTDFIFENETLSDFARRNIVDKEIRYGNDINQFINDIKKWNPKISNWNNLKSGTQLYIDYPYPEYVPDANYSKELLSNNFNSEEKQKFSLFGFYTSSVGNYSEKTSDQSLKSGQNFPITLGIGANLTNTQKIHFLNGSIYWAKPTSGEITGANDSGTQKISIPGELGYNLYYQYFFSETLTGLYSGYDFEDLNTFNTDQLVLGDSVKNISNKIHYGTIGVSQSFLFKSLMQSWKISFSKTLASETTGIKKLEGYKYMLFLSLRPEGKFNYNFLFKHHELEGPTKLSINRFGIGIGLQFF